MTGNVTFDRFYGEHYGRLASSLSLVCGNKQLGEELAQEAFIKAFSKWSEVAGMESPGGWLYRVAFNMARSHWRVTAKRKFIRFEEAEIHYTDAPSADAAELKAAIARLPLKQRSVVVTRYVLGYSTEEAAALLGMTPSALRVTLHRASLTLRLDPSIAPSEEQA